MKTGSLEGIWDVDASKAEIGCMITKGRSGTPVDGQADDMVATNSGAAGTHRALINYGRLLDIGFRAATQLAWV